MKRSSANRSPNHQGNLSPARKISRKTDIENLLTSNNSEDITADHFTLNHVDSPLDEPSSSSTSRKTSVVSVEAEIVKPTPPPAKPTPVVLSFGKKVMWEVSLRLNPPFQQHVVKLVPDKPAVPIPGYHLLLDKEYTVEGIVSRQYYTRIDQVRGKEPNVVWEWCWESNPCESWYDDLRGLKRLAYFVIKEDGDSNNRWELYLKPTQTKRHVYGYLCRAWDLRQSILKTVKDLLYCYKLPLVMDLDDTLVRMLPKDSEKIPLDHKHRLRVLADGEIVLVAEGVDEFLDWVKEKFEITICSVGDPVYVKKVVDMLDQGKNRITGIRYSARAEHEYLSNRQRQRNPNDTKPPPPPKSLEALYAFCNLPFSPQINHRRGPCFLMPLIMDDQVRCWPEEQWDNIIVVKELKGSSVWNVRLDGFRRLLEAIHTDVFLRLEPLMRNGSMEKMIECNGGASVVGIYKERLRDMLATAITKGWEI